MSETMKALEQSEQSYNSHQSQVVMPLGTAPKKRSLVSLNVALLLVPVVAVSGLVVFNQYRAQLKGWQAENQGEVIVMEVPAPVTIEPYVGLQTLASTKAEQPFVEEVYVAPKAVKPAKSVQIKDSKPKVKVTQKKAVVQDAAEQDELLQNIDLSELSPELLQRVEAVMGDSANAQVRDSRIQDLSQVSADWQGKLPALNFQTHVYTSDVNKRWVKINNVEYKQGDWIADDLKLMTIEPQACVIRYQQELLRVPALYEWNG